MNRIPDAMKTGLRPLTSEKGARIMGAIAKPVIDQYRTFESSSILLLVSAQLKNALTAGKHGDAHISSDVADVPFIRHLLNARTI